MNRWLVIPCLVILGCPSSVLAKSTILAKSSVLAKSRTHGPRHRHEHHAHSAAQAAAGRGSLAETSRAETGSARSDSGHACTGGNRIVSAYYSQGRRTANGDRFNPHGMTAAHRTLPFGTQLTVSNPRTGKSVSVVVNDRGPFVKGVSLDLSLGAAEAIGMRGTGSVCIR